MNQPGINARWALSFADLCLLLLGFFVLLQARSGDPGQVTQGVRAAFGGDATVSAEAVDLPATTLFEPGEAVLRPAARARLIRLGAAARRAGDRVTVRSAGRDATARRFDGWELASARVAAAARAIAAGGLAEGRIQVEMPATDASGQRQRLRITRS